MQRLSWIAPLALGAIFASDVGAQTPVALAPTAPPVPTVQAGPAAPQATEVRSGFQVRSEFREVMNQYPSTLREVLQRDPALMLDTDFIAPYPVLAAFLAQHPEVAHNPVYFLGQAQGGGISEEVAVVMVFMTIAVLAGWLIRTGIEYRRWSRTSHVQAETQAKLIDRFSGSEDLLAYLETPAGRRFMESTPMQSEAGSMAPGAPTNRILWSLQTGLVLGLGGWGLHFAIPRLADPVAADPLYVIGTVAIALGIGFILSAMGALLLSSRLGLIRPGERPRTGEATTRPKP